MAYVIYKKPIVIVVSIAIPIFLLTITNLKSKIKKSVINVFLITFICFYIVISRNNYFKTNYVKAIVYLLYIFLPFIMMLNSKNKYIINGFRLSLNIFGIEHITCTYIATFFKNVYVQYLVPIIKQASVESLAYSQFKNGLNPGFTTHYSTNASYLSIISIYAFSEYINNKKKSRLILLILSFVALLLTGKRAHPVFVIVSCIIYYFIVNKDKISKKWMNFATTLIVGFTLFNVLASFMPQMLTFINRFEELSNSQRGVLNGREEMYSLGFDLWNKHILFGNGWGSYSINYQKYLYINGISDSSYLDCHNIYIQLLCETGVTGLTLFLIITLGTLIMSIKLRLKMKESMLDFAIIYQIFFLMYGFSGNPLYDPQCYVIYFVCIGIFLIYYMKGKEYEKDKNNYISQST